MKRTPDINVDQEQILSKIQCFALDMDGTIYLGEQWIDGIIHLVILKTPVLVILILPI